MFCSGCGHELPEEARFCSMCGQAVQHMRPRRDKVAEMDWASLVEEFNQSTGEAHSAAFAALYEASYDAVYAHVYRYAQNEDAANDAVQNAYVICWNRLGQLENARNFLPWMKRIAYNEFLGSVRKGSREQLFGVLTDADGGEASEEDFLADDTLPLPEDGLAAEELHRLLLDAINELPDGQRIAIKEYYFDNKPVQEIADDLGVPENTIKTHLSRGRKRIAQSVDSYANAYGLRLVPLALIPFLASLVKEDVYACEHVATAAGSTAAFATIQAALGIHVSTGTAAAAGTASAAGSAGAAAGSAGAIGGTSAAGSAGASSVTGAAGTAGSTVGASAGALGGMAAGGTTAAGATTAGVAGSSTAGAAGAIGSGLAVKAGAGIVAVAVAAGGTGAYIHSQRAIEIEPEPVVHEAATEQVTEEAPEEGAGRISQEERTAAMYQYVSENMEIAEEADLQGSYSIQNDRGTDYNRYYLVNGDYIADEGVFAILRNDIDVDGDDELLVFSRTTERDSSIEGLDDWSGWRFLLQVVDMTEANTVSITDAETIMAINNPRDGYITDDQRFLTVYYKDLDGVPEILCYEHSMCYMNVSGGDGYYLTGYRYKNGRLEYIDMATYGGTDPWGIGEDTELLGALRHMGLDTTARLVETLKSDGSNIGYEFEGLIAGSQEGLTSVLRLDTVTTLDEQAWYDAYTGDNAMNFDPSPYSISLELVIDDGDDVVYSAE